MNRSAVFVDAGYLYAQAALSIGASNNRSNLRLDESELVNQLKNLSITLSAGAQLLRIYWYDGAKYGMTTEQLALADMPDLKVRLGSINSAGQQKGVDSLLVTDMIDLARNQAISDALIVTGDGDMRVAVQIAQSFGVRVHLVGLEPSRTSQSVLLRQEADTVHEVSKTDVARFMRVTAIPQPLASLPPASQIVSQVSPSVEDCVSRAIHLVLSAVTGEELDRLQHALASTNRIPQQYDGRILGTCRSLVGRDLDEKEKRSMRSAALHYIQSLVDATS